MALTIKQEKFCLEYVKSGNARTAYIAAGYSHNKDGTTDVNACRLLKNDKIKARLAELANEIKNDSIADAVEMQETLTKIIRRELPEEVIVDGEIMTKKASLKDVVNAIEKLGRMQGCFDNKLSVELAIPVYGGEEEFEAEEE